jgi:phosphoribosylamine-glycine ligase
VKFLFVSPEALSLDLAYTLKQEGNEVKFCVQSATEKDVGDGFVDKIDEWESHIDWADVIVFDDIGFGKVAEKLRAEGKKVVGGSVYTDRLENEREFGQQELEKAGVSVLPSWNFSDFEEAIKFVQQNPGRYVIKPSGKAQNEKELLFVGQEADGNDVINVLAHYKKRWSNKIRIFQLQKFSFGVEVAVGAFFNGKEFAHPINTNFEHKRLFPDNIGPSTGEMGCYDDKTEVLTDGGWKLFKDLTYDSRICTLNPLTRVIEYHRPTAIVSFRHHRKLVSIQNRALDINVTLDHNMYVCSQQNRKNGTNKFEFVKAKDLEYQSVIKRTGTWIGVEQEYFVLPSIPVGHCEGRQVVFHTLPEIQIPMDDWLAFLGIWISDGSALYNKISVTQKTPRKTALIEKMLSRLPFKFTRGKNEFYCYNKQLYSYLQNFGRAWEKHVPDFVKELSPRQIAIFLDWYALGDATMMKNNFRIFYTSSKRLADDVQELLLKIARLGIVKTRKRVGPTWIVDHAASRSRVQYEVIERVKKLDSYIDRRDTKIIDYSGRVYCATVKNHVMYVRRSGKPYWCGNTLMWWSDRNKIFEQTLEKMKPRLAESGYVGYIDINCIANGTGIYPLEFTSRFGYPTISIQMEGVTSKWGQFIHSLASGENAHLKTKPGFQVGVVIAVPPFPFNDEKTFRKFSEDAAILFNKPDYAGVHLGEIKREGDDWRIAGRSGYSLIVTGSGNTTEEARAVAYKRVANIMIPNMFYRTDIGSRWVRDSDLLLSFGYLN